MNGRSVAKIAELEAQRSADRHRRLARRTQAADRQQLAGAAQDDLAEREVTIMGDKDTPFAVLKRVMATATDADYGKVSLAVIQREREVGAGA